MQWAEKALLGHLYIEGLVIAQIVDLDVNPSSPYAQSARLDAPDRPLAAEPLTNADPATLHGMNTSSSVTTRHNDLHVA